MGRRFWFTLLASLCVLLTLVSFVHAAEPSSSSVGSLSWKDTSVSPTISLAEASRAATIYIGLAGTQAPDQSRFVQITDTMRCDSVARTVLYGWRLHYSGVAVTHPQTGETVTLGLSVLIDAGQGSDRRPTKALVAAFTDPNRDAWVSPVLPARDYTVAMQDDGWNLSCPKKTPLNSTITKMLAVFWVGNGIHPASAGQLLLRPMLAKPALPAERKGDRLTPIWSADMYWTILVSGTKTHVITGPDPVNAGTSAGRGPERYMTGLVALYRDMGAQSVRGVYLP